MELNEAIKHCKDKAQELKTKVEVYKTEPYVSPNLIADCEECAAEHEQLAEWLTELQERRKADKWISVKERMPEPRVAVMVYCPEYKNQYCAFYEDKHWQVFGAYDTVWHEVTHWKPLSQNPEESEDNK